MSLKRESSRAADEQDFEPETGKFARGGTPDDASADDEDIGCRAVECLVLDGRGGSALHKALERDAVDHAQAPLDLGGKLARLDDALPILALTRERDRPAEVLRGESRVQLNQFLP